MKSAAFDKTLRETAYLLPNGEPAPGLTQAGEDVSYRLRPLLSDTRVGLQADAVYAAQSVPTSVFKDAGHAPPTAQELKEWHEAAWNVGVAPLLWIITPTDIRLYDCYASPRKDGLQADATEPLEIVPLDSPDRLRSLDSMCGRFATETGAFWSSPIGQKIDRRHRVDRELLREINALEERLTQLSVPSGRSGNAAAAIKRARDFAQRLIGRTIFISYLMDRGIAQRFLPPGFPTDVARMLSSVESTFALFKWLRKTFNGDLFPMDNPDAEHRLLQKAHVELLGDFVQGRSLLSGQGRLFRFRYDAIPVDLISSIYQQFARSSAAEEAHVQGLHYTPIELVHLALDPVTEALPANARVIDPTCGSGAFLVEAFRRLVWKCSQGRPVARSTVRKVLYQQLYGIDINKSALAIAAFSLYLAALELDEEPLSDISDLKFDHLIGTTLFEADTLDPALPPAIAQQPFDAVVGNPPWTFVRQAQPRKRPAGGKSPGRPRRSPDQEFLWVAARLAGDKGRIGMVMKSSPFFSRDSYAIAAREALLRKLAPAALVNLSALRKEELFPDATGPALLFFARCALIEQKPDRLLVGSIPWTPDFRRSGVFEVGPGEFKSVPLERILRTPPTLKAATFGTVRDGWLIEKLERSFPTLGAFLEASQIAERGQGFQVTGSDPDKPPSEYYELRVLTPEHYTPYRVERRALPRFQHRTLHRARNPAIFRGPLLICPEGSFLNTTGRYSTTVSRGDVLYTESFYGISFFQKKRELPYLLNAILSSSITTFQLAFGGSAWGLERTKVKPLDVLALRIPDLTSLDPTQQGRLLEVERQLAEDPGNPECLGELDEVVGELYDLARDEVVLTNEAVACARMLLFEGRQERMQFVKAPRKSDLSTYAGEVVRTVNAYLRARGQRHLEAMVYPMGSARPAAAGSVPGITAVRFAMVSGAPTNAPIVKQAEQSDVELLSSLFRSQDRSDVPPYLNERRQLRIYRDGDLFVLKPSEIRYWTRTAGLNDADVILADHWITGRHAPAA